MARRNSAPVVDDPEELNEDQVGETEEEETQDQPERLQRQISGPKDMLGAEINPPKSNKNQAFHDDIKKRYGKDVVDTRDGTVLFEGRHYGPGLVRCEDATRADHAGNQVPISDFIRAAVDKYYESPQPVVEAINAPVSPEDIANRQQNSSSGVDRIPNPEEETE